MGGKTFIVKLVASRSSSILVVLVIMTGASFTTMLNRQASAFPSNLVPDVMLKAGMKPIEIKVVDINYDTLLDIITVNDDGNDTSFFLQQANRSFNFTPDFSLPAGETPTSVEIDDLDRDGLLDIVVANNGCFIGPASCDLLFFYQRPNYSYPSIPDQVISRWDILPWDLAVADYNSDGLLDVASSNQGNAGTFIFLQLPAGGFPNAPDWVLPKSPGVSFGIVGTDLNSDGLDDIALANYDAWSVSIYYQRSDHTIPLLPDLNLSSGDGPIHVTPGDLDGDGLTDLVVTNGKEHTFSLFYQRRDYTLPGTPDMKVNIGGTGFGKPMHSAIGDVDNDGLSDIVVTRTSQDVASVFIQRPSGGFSPSPSFNLSATGSREAAIADIDGDGLNDIALTIYLDNFLENVYIYYQEPVGSSPLTTLSVGNPRVNGLLTSVTSSTPLSLNVVDRSGTGIASTRYRVNNGSWWTYLGAPFSLATEGVNAVDFYSVDNAGNTEPIRTTLLAVDDTSPTTAVSIGDPHYQSSITWISPATGISLAAVDGPSPSVGTNSTSYRTWGNTGWSPWSTYAGTFNLVEEGTGFIEFFSEDLLGNTETTRNVSVVVDGSPPTSFIEAPFVMNGTRALSIVAVDAGVGPSSIHFSIDGAPWSEHSSIVYMDGSTSHAVRYYSDDLLGNIELERTASFPASSAGPLTFLQVGNPSYGTLPVFLTSSTSLSLSAQDRSGTGINVTRFRIDGGAWTNYSVPFSLSGEGAHEILYYSVDNASQQGTMETSTLILDDSGPEAALLQGGGSHAVLGGRLFATSSSLFTMHAVDKGVLPVGASNITYSTWTGSGWLPWTSYGTPFSLGPQEGARWIRFHATDLLGNTGAVTNSTVIIDDTPPTSSIAIGHPRHQTAHTHITSATEIMLTASDDGIVPVGLDAIGYRVDGGSWQRYAFGFIMIGDDGPHSIEYNSTDILGNTESVNTFTIHLDNTPPATTLSPATGPYTPATMFTLTANDSGCGVNVTFYRVDGGSWIVYGGGFTLPEGVHSVSFYSIDMLGNKEEVRWRELTIPGVPPSEVEANYKPVVALIFAIILLIAGLWSSRKRPWDGGENWKAVVKAFVFTSMPFVLAEATTGIVSLVTGELAIPPAMGSGTALDTGILVAGLTVAVLIATREKNTGTMREKAQGD